MTQNATPRRGRPAVPEAELRAKIQQAAFQLLQDKGYAAVSIDEIARMAGVAKKTIYRFHSNKDALIEEIILDWSSTNLLPELAQPRDAGEVIAALEQFFLRLAERVLSMRQVALYKFLQSGIEDKEKFLRIWRDNGIENAAKQLNAWFEQARRQQLIHPDWPVDAAQYLQAMIIAPSLRDISLGLHPPVPEWDIRPRIRQTLRFVAPMLLAPPVR
ncbi:TetR/AcrR family transcriptional regulator [Pantoea sp.]|uniref:TetR/AcrR family transcriptional regulator n=1 Tax=Pantoea sp. TaxID=69393 RepID=UPI002899DF77|nr:TetR/AcrR family transcriptional regulator [Pantoea sp.]